MWKKMLLLFSGMLLMLGACGSQEEAALKAGAAAEAEAEKVPERENPCLLESGSMADTGEILPSESGLVWVRIIGGEDIDSGEGTSALEHGDIAAYIQGEDVYIAAEAAEGDLWDIWKLPGYGEWMEQEIRIFLRVMTGMEA